METRQKGIRVQKCNQEAKTSCLPFEKWRKIDHLYSSVPQIAYMYAYDVIHYNTHSLVRTHTRTRERTHSRMRAHLSTYTEVFLRMWKFENK